MPMCPIFSASIWRLLYFLPVRESFFSLTFANILCFSVSNICVLLWVSGIPNFCLIWTLKFCCEFLVYLIFISFDLHIYFYSCFFFLPVKLTNCLVLYPPADTLIYSYNKYFFLQTVLLAYFPSCQFSVWHHHQLMVIKLKLLFIYKIIISISGASLIDWSGETCLSFAYFWISSSQIILVLR